MRKTLVIAWREYFAVVRSKAFLISLVLLPVMMFAPGVVQQATSKVMDIRDRRFAVVDRTSGAQLFPELAKAGVSQEKFDALLAQVPVVNKGLPYKDAKGVIQPGEEMNQLASMMVPFGLVFLMFIVVLIGAIPLMQGIIEEKQQRIAEVL